MRRNATAGHVFAAPIYFGHKSFPFWLCSFKTSKTDYLMGISKAFTSSPSGAHVFTIAFAIFAVVR
jgi:hypothetical protein